MRALLLACLAGLLALASACASSPATVRVERTIDVGGAPHGMRVDPDGRHAWLAEAGGNTVARIDLEKGVVDRRFDAGKTPLDVVPDGAGGLWVTQFLGAELLHLGPDGAMLGKLPVGAGPSLFDARGVGGRFALVSEGADELTLFDPRAGEVVKKLPTGKRPYPAAVTRDGTLAFVPDRDAGTVTVLDLLNEETAATVDVGGKPRGGALTVDDVSYVVATAEPDALVFVNTASFEVVARVTEGVGPAPFAVCIPGDGRIGLVNDAGGERIDVLDVAARRITGHVRVGKQPIVVRGTPDGLHALVSSEVSDTLSVLRLPGPPAPPPFVAPNEVVVMGMIHDGHETSTRYGLDLVRELVRTIDPDVVCVEIPPNRMEAAWKGFRETGELIEPRARRFPEYAQVLFPLSREMDFEIVPTAGWTEPMARFRSEAMKRIAADPARAADWSEYQAAQKASEAAIARGGAPDDPHWIHTDAYDDAADVELAVYDRLFDDELGPGGWSHINAAHWANIERTLNRVRGRGLRVLITYGAYHKGWFLRRLRERDDIRLLPVEPFLERAEATLRDHGAGATTASTL